MEQMLETMDPGQYILERVDDQLTYYEKAANKAKSKHVTFQTSILVLALLVPVIANLKMDTGVLNYSVTITSLLLAMLTGIANFRKFGDLWLSYRTTEESIKREKFLFLTSSGKYAGNDAAFSEFVGTMESILSAEHNKFRSLIEDAQRPTAPAAHATGNGAPSPP